MSYILLIVTIGVVGGELWVSPFRVFEPEETWTQIKCRSDVETEYCPMNWVFEPKIWWFEPKLQSNWRQVIPGEDYMITGQKKVNKCHSILYLQVKQETIGRYTCVMMEAGKYETNSIIVTSQKGLEFPPIPLWMITASRTRRLANKRQNRFVREIGDEEKIRDLLCIRNLYGKQEEFQWTLDRYGDGGNECDLTLEVSRKLTDKMEVINCSGPRNQLNPMEEKCASELTLEEDDPRCSRIADILWAGICHTPMPKYSDLEYICNKTTRSQTLEPGWIGLCRVEWNRVSRPTPLPMSPIPPPIRKTRATTSPSLSECKKCIIRVKEGNKIKETLSYTSKAKCNGKVTQCQKGNITYNYCHKDQRCYDIRETPDQVWFQVRAGGKNGPVQYKTRIPSKQSKVMIQLEPCKLSGISSSLGGKEHCGNIDWQRTYIFNDKYICPKLPKYAWRDPDCTIGTAQQGYCPKWGCVKWATASWKGLKNDATLKKVPVQSTCKTNECNIVNFTINNPSQFLADWGSQFGIRIYGQGRDPIGLFYLEFQTLKEIKQQVTYDFYSDFWKEIKKPFEIPDIARNLFVELAGTVAEALNVTNCYVCGGTNVGDQWPWEAAEWNISKPFNATGQPPHQNDSVWDLRQDLVFSWCVERYEENTPVLGLSRCEQVKVLNITSQNVSYWPNSTDNLPRMWPGNNESKLLHWPTDSHSMVQLNWNKTWPAPNGLYWLCGRRAFSQLPEKWTGRCALGEIRPAFFLIPLGEGERLSHPVYDRKKRALKQQRIVEIYQDQEWDGKTWTPEKIIDTYGPATWAQDGLHRYRTPIYMLNRIIRLQAVLELVTRENAVALNLLARQATQLRNAVYQNRLALDYLLATEGGVCGKFNLSNCCLQIDDNGKVIEDITERMIKLVHVPPQEWTSILDKEGLLGGIFANWKQALFMCGIIVVGLMMLPCLIPLIRNIVQSSINGMIQAQSSVKSVMVLKEIGD